MNFIKKIFIRSKALAILGTFFFILSLVLLLFIPGNKEVVLGINSLIKPLKFSVSLWIYSWTMACLIPYFKKKKLKKNLTCLIIFVMLYEQLIITVQAFRGRLSHFNIETTVEMTLFNLMGLFISLLTAYTFYAAILFWLQKDKLEKTKKEAIFYGLLIFVISSFMGGVMGAILSHNVGGKMGSEGLPFVNWSTTMGDIRVAHFIGIHALQIIPLFGFMMVRKINSTKKSLTLVRWFSITYMVFVISVFIQALLGYPFISN